MPPNYKLLKYQVPALRANFEKGDDQTKTDIIKYCSDIAISALKKLELQYQLMSIEYSKQVADYLGYRKALETDSYTNKINKGIQSIIEKSPNPSHSRTLEVNKWISEFQKNERLPPTHPTAREPIDVEKLKNDEVYREAAIFSAANPKISEEQQSAIDCLKACIHWQEQMHEYLAIEAINCLSSFGVLDPEIQKQKSLEQSAIASRIRPGARNPLREKIISAMKTRKREGDSFKAFLKNWQTDDIDGIRIEQPDASVDFYQVEDMNDTSEKKLGYKAGSLEVMFSKC